jgi:hypothetical protein
MRRLLILLIILIGGGLAVPQLPTRAVLNAAQNAATTTVYVTKTGEKYHRDGCRYLSRSKIATTLKAAVARGLGPCSVCRPPASR